MIGNRKILAVCMARIQDEMNHNYIAALKNAVSAEGYSLMVYTTCSVVKDATDYSDPELYIYDYMQYEYIDAVLIYEELILNQAVTDELIRRAQERDIPVIVIGEKHEGCLNVMYDHENEFADVVRHMVEVHHLSKFHFMAGTKGNPFSECRLKSFKKTLGEYGLPFDDTMVSYGNFWAVPAEHATEKLIAAGNLPEAILCANDQMAMAVCGVLNKYGIKVPEQVAVTGFDGVKEIAFTSPRITSVICDPNDIAEVIKLILLKIKELNGKTETFLVPMKLCIAESCGCKGATTQDASEHFNILNNRLYRFQEEELELFKVAAQILRCETPDQIAVQMKHPILYNMCCVLEKDCVDEAVKPTYYVPEERAEDREMLVLYETSDPDNFTPYYLPIKKIIPPLDYVLEHDYMMIFTVLYHVGVPLGYVCYFFNEMDTGNCIKVPQTTNAIGSAIGGYRNLQYEKYLSQKISDMYKKDMLTGLYNRRGFEQAYQKFLASRKKGARLTVILADLDGLKQINDNFGHKEGDYAIHAVAQALIDVCPEGSLLTRFGGDEMLAVCDGSYVPDILKEEFESYFNNLNEKESKEYRIDASVGIYVTEENEVPDFKELIEKSDKFMYEEKKKRKSKQNL